MPRSPLVLIQAKPNNEANDAGCPFDVSVFRYRPSVISCHDTIPAYPSAICVFALALGLHQNRVAAFPRPPRMLAASQRKVRACEPHSRPVGFQRHSWLISFSSDVSDLGLISRHEAIFDSFLAPWTPLRTKLVRLFLRPFRGMSLDRQVCVSTAITTLLPGNREAFLMTKCLIRSLNGSRGSRKYSCHSIALLISAN